VRFNIYLVLLFLLVHSKIVRFNLFWKLSPFIVIVLIMFGLLIPMGWGAPQGAAVVVRNSVAIVPDVAGEVTEVPVVANAPLKSGDVLFRIDPVPYDSQVRPFRRNCDCRRRRNCSRRMRDAVLTSSSGRPKPIS
jgi:multidrug resistance efflux pump